MRQRNIRIIATLGPASNSPDMIRKLFEAGADVFRLNLSHLKPADIEPIHSRIRDVEKEIGHPIGILADLQGPKFRIGSFADGPISLEEGLYIITMGGAYAMEREDSIGSIEQGKYADFIVLESNLFEIPPQDLDSVRVLRTVFEGEAVYQAKE